MKRCTAQNGVKQKLLMGLLAAGASLVIVAQPAFPGDNAPADSKLTREESASSTSQQPDQERADSPGGSSGMTIHIDPLTGAILKEPAAGALPLQLSASVLNALSTSHQGLVEAWSPVPGGGVKVDLQGRFRSPLFATIGADGKVKILHLGEIPGSDHYE
jgi:hypothetical protein